MLPAEDRDHVRNDPATRRLIARLGAADRAGYAPDLVTAAAVRDLQLADQEISAAAITEHLDTHLPNALNIARNRWIDAHQVEVERLESAGIAIRSGHPTLGTLIDDIAARERLSGETAMQLAGQLQVRSTRARTAAGDVDPEKLLTAWREDHPVAALAADPRVPSWLPAPPLAEGNEHAVAHHRHLAETIAAAGSQLAIDRPLWTETLGDYPTDQTAQHRWEHLAGQIQAWRTDHDITSDVDPIGPKPVDANYLHQQAHRDLQRDLEELRRAHHAEHEGAAAAELEHDPRIYRGPTRDTGDHTSRENTHNRRL